MVAHDKWILLILLSVPRILFAFLPSDAEVRTRDVMAYRERKKDEYQVAQEQHEQQMVWSDSQVRDSMGHSPWTQDLHAVPVPGTETAKVLQEKNSNQSYKKWITGLLLLTGIGGLTLWSMRRARN